MDSFLIALGSVFIAEMGDKTQLVALTLAGRYRARLVLLGILVATAVAHILSLALGRIAQGFLDGPWTTFASGLCFIFFGLWTWRGDEDDENIRKALTPFMVVFWTFLLAELGDKTMLTTAVVTAQIHHSYFAIWLGSTIGMVAADALAIGVGVYLGTRLPEKEIRILAAVIFMAFGLWSAVYGGSQLGPLAWLAGLICLSGATLILFRNKFLAR